MNSGAGVPAFPTTGRPPAATPCSPKLPTATPSSATWRGEGDFDFAFRFSRLAPIPYSLVLIAERKVYDLRQHEQRRKRGGGKVQDEAALEGTKEGSAAGLAQVIGREPTPALAAQVAEACQRLLDALGEDQLRTVALGKLEGYTNDEIAAKLDLSRPTVERKPHRIRRLWTKETDHEVRRESF
jgi:DNA-directed RNA polymerase specialized sigma24 family protein